MNNKLQEILKETREDLKIRKREKRIEMLKQVQHDKKKENFKKVILSPKKEIALIAEIKLASPSEGILGSKEDILQRVKQYEKAGADAISYVTEKHFFNGDISFISQIKKAISLPILMKDFIMDEYQILEAKNAGADAILLIARVVSEKKLLELVKICKDLDIEPIVEIDTTDDIEKAISSKPNIIAVNARDLDTFEVDVKRACKILKEVPDAFIKLGFSGIKSFHEVEIYKEAGVQGVLIGTNLMRSKNIELFIHNLEC